MTDDKDNDKKSDGKNLTSAANNKGILSGNTINFIIKIGGNTINITTEKGIALFNMFAICASKASEEIYDFLNDDIHAAKVNAKVKKIEQKSKHEIAEKDMEHKLITLRMEKRTYEEQMEHQKNLENISGEAIKHLKEDADPEGIDKDWSNKFSQDARTINDEYVQEIWGRLLAEKANDKRSFSKNTISVLASMEKQDAEDFANVCSFVFRSNNENILFIKDVEKDIYAKNGVTFDVLFRLSELGLLYIGDSGIGAGVPSDHNLKEAYGPYSYFGEFFVFFLGSYSMNMGHVKLTKAGEELSKICVPEKIQGFLEHMQTELRKQGHGIKKAILNEKGEYRIIE